jgi:hypothetical protein
MSQEQNRQTALLRPAPSESCDVVPAVGRELVTHGHTEALGREGAGAPLRWDGEGTSRKARAN